MEKQNQSQSWVKQIEDMKILNNNLQSKNIDWKPFVELLQDAIHQLRLTNLVKLSLISYGESKDTVTWSLVFSLPNEDPEEVYETIVDLPNFIDDLETFSTHANLNERYPSVSFEFIVSK